MTSGTPTCTRNYNNKELKEDLRFTGRGCEFWKTTRQKRPSLTVRSIRIVLILIKNLRLSNQLMEGKRGRGLIQNLLIERGYCMIGMNHMWKSLWIIVSCKSKRSQVSLNKMSWWSIDCAKDKQCIGSRQKIGLDVILKTKTRKFRR